MLINQNDEENLQKTQEEYDKVMKMYNYLEDFNPKATWPDIIRRVTLCSYYIDMLLSITEH